MENSNDSINNQKTDFNDSINSQYLEFELIKRSNEFKYALKNLNQDENHYGSYQKRQLLNVATQIYCAKAFANVNGHKESLIKTSVEEAKLLIEKCNE